MKIQHHYIVTANFLSWLADSCFFILKEQNILTIIGHPIADKIK